MDRQGRTLKNWRLWILLAGIASFCAAFLCLDFRMAASNTQSEKKIITTSTGDGLLDAMQRSEKINLALVGEGPLIAALQVALAVEMNNAGIGDIEPVQGIEPGYQNPVLVIKVGRPVLFWTPFFASSRFTVQVGYSSIGDTTFMGETPITIDNQDRSALNLYGEYNVTDRSWGLISRRGYHRILADYLARQIVTALRDLYRVST